MAARLRAVYAKLASERSYLAHCEEEIVDALARIREFETDPELFAELHYYGVTGSAESYPVQTTIERMREKLSYRSRRLPVYMQRIVDAEENVRAAEREVLEQLAKMRPSAGRVPWPSEPNALDRYRKDEQARRQKERKKLQKSLEQNHQRNLTETALRKVEHDESLRESDRQVEIAASMMPPRKAMAYRAFYYAMRRAFDAGRFGVKEIAALGGGDRAGLGSIMQEAMRDVETQLEEGWRSASP